MSFSVYLLSSGSALTLSPPKSGYGLIPTWCLFYICFTLNTTNIFLIKGGKDRCSRGIDTSMLALLGPEGKR